MSVRITCIILLTLLVCGIGPTGQATEQDPAEVQSSDKSIQSGIEEQPGKRMLKGRVENSLRLPPVDRSFRAGSRLDLARLKALTPDNHWERIPDWAAGTWKTETNSTFYSFDYGIKSHVIEVDTFVAWSVTNMGMAAR